MIYAGIISNRDEEKTNISDLQQRGQSDGFLFENENVKILLFLSGRGDIVSEGHLFPFVDGKIFVIPKKSEYTIKPIGKYKAIMISGSFRMLYQQDSICVVSDNSNCEGRRLAELILLNRNGNEGYLGCLCDAFVQFILLNTDRATKNTSAAISKIILRMEREFGSSDLSIGKLLDDSGYTRDYIRSEFENVTGMTPKKYLNQVRMNKAKSLIELCGNEMTIGEIAERCGVIDHTIFSRIFKKHFGISPTQYKESLRK